MDASDQLPPPVIESLAVVYQAVDQLLQAYDKQSNIHTIAPFVQVLREWRDFIRRSMEAKDLGAHPLP
jgi:hypothetical protein